MRRRPPRAALFPYTTLFRSVVGRRRAPAARGHTNVRKLTSGVKFAPLVGQDRKSTRLNSSHRCISYAVFCLKKKTHTLALRYLQHQKNTRPNSSHIATSCSH